MMPASNSAAAGGGRDDGRMGLWHWNSPVPYLFAGLAMMLGIITIALMILACSCRKSLSRNSSSAREDEEKAAAKQVERELADSDPKIVVIMAGDENPTFLAKPMSVSCSCQNDEQV